MKKVWLKDDRLQTFKFVGFTMIFFLFFSPWNFWNNSSSGPEQSDKIISFYEKAKPSTFEFLIFSFLNGSKFAVPIQTKLKISKFHKPFLEIFCFPNWLGIWSGSEAEEPDKDIVDWLVCDFYE